jgi:23S rRNA pseudouridine1911/1915/1917 synthase
LTAYTVLQEFVGLSLLEVRPETGRTHQIRVHLSENKHPIVGDTLYGAKSFMSSIKGEAVIELLEAVDRPLLHARSLQFIHPATKEAVIFQAPWPPVFHAVFSGLGGQE